MTKLFSLIAAAAITLIAHGASAQTYPTKDHPITIVVPFAAGGPSDRVARDLAEAMRRQFDNQSFIVDNTAGAGGSIGTAKVAHSTPDGYTLLFNHVAMATIPSLIPNLSFNVETSFEYLGVFNDVPMTVIARPTLAANNFKELSAWIGANKGKINIGNAGIGSAAHLCGVLFQNAMKAEMTAVPYKGTAPAIADLIGGQIDLLCDQTTNTTSFIESKKVKAYAVTTPRRLTIPALKDLPTLQELGLKNFEVTIWHGLYAPKGTPAPVLAKLNAAVRAVTLDPEFVKREQDLGAVINSDERLTPEGHRKFLRAEVNKWTPVLKATDATAN